MPSTAPHGHQGHQGHQGHRNDQGRGPARLQLFEHVNAPLADLPVLEVVSASHILTDLTLGPASRHMLAHLGPGMARRWRDLGDPALDEQTVDALATAAEAAYGTDHYAELTEARDRAQVAVLRARELDDTDVPRTGGEHR